jgi:sugar phosphate isomerase/epimerase
MKLGLTLFSLINEWQTGRCSLRDLLERVAADNLGPSVEVVGGQSFRNFPFVASEEARDFRESMDRLQLEPTALGVFADSARLPDRLLTDDEIVSEFEHQIDAAVTLGFPMVRAGLGLSPSVLEALVAHLEHKEVIFTLELQGATHPDSPVLIETLRAFERLQSGYLGLTLDFSLYMPAIPLTLENHLSQLGVGAATIAALGETFRGENDGWRSFEAAAAADHTPRAIIEQCRGWLFRFGRTPPEAFGHVLPWVHHAHAKYWDLERPETDIVEPYRAFLQMLLDSGYEGAIASEWGGCDWLEIADIDAFDLTSQHLALIANIVAGLTQ